MFGARGTGKSTFIEQQIVPHLKGEYLVYDLLDDEVEERLLREPSLLETDLTKNKKRPKSVIIDEIQKVPRLLDVVHLLIEKHKIKFILSGSSARKLKKAGANLLGARAFEYRLYPLSFLELGENFSLSEALNYGSLPDVINFQDPGDKQKYLKTYVSTYVKLEVQMEQLLRKPEPFKMFLEVAGQMNGKALNFSKISKEVGVDGKTIMNYYQILEETYLGFILPAYHSSLRKSLLLSPKFYFFDVGIKRALERSLQSPPVPGTSYYGETFEHFVINEIYKINSYTEADYSLSYFSTKEGSEVDLVLTRGPSETIFIEIKSSKKVNTEEVKKLAKLVLDTPIKAFFLSQDPHVQIREGVSCMPWDLGILEIFSLNICPASIITNFL